MSSRYALACCMCSCSVLQCVSQCVAVSHLERSALTSDFCYLVQVCVFTYTHTLTHTHLHTHMNMQEMAFYKVAQNNSTQRLPENAKLWQGTLPCALSVSLSLTHTHTCTRAYIYAHTSARVLHIHARTETRTHTHTHIHTYTH